MNMAMTPEAKVKKLIKLHLNDMGAYFIQPIGTGFGSNGAPDIVACYKGMFIGIEAKAGKGKTTALQEFNLTRIKFNDGLALVINETNVSQLKELIESWVNSVQTKT
jgi:Holliday junction resolvase